MIKNDNYIFLIGIYYPYGEFNIMGVYTDERKLLNTYQLLVTEDGRCLKEKFSEMPVIYRIPLNQFLGQQEDCNQMNEIPYFYSNLEPEYRITIDEITRHIKIAEFYGCTVYCNLDFSEGPYIDIEYAGGGENDSRYIRIDIEKDSMIGDFGYLRNVIEEWYQDNNAEAFARGRMQDFIFSFKENARKCEKEIHVEYKQETCCIDY